MGLAPAKGVEELTPPDRTDVVRATPTERPGPVAATGTRVHVSRRLTCPRIPIHHRSVDPGAGGSKQARMRHAAERVSRERREAE